MTWHYQKQIAQWYTYSTITIIALKVNELNTPKKRQRLSDWIKKQVQLYDVIRDRPQIKKYMSLKAKKWKKKYQVNNKCKWTGLAIKQTRL